MWNYSVETTTLVSVHTQNVVVPRATASLKKRHIHQEPVNLTWYGKRCSQVEQRSQGISTGPRWMIGVPTGEIWTDTQGEGHTEREAEPGVLPVTSKRQQGPWATPSSEDRLQGPLSLRASRGTHGWRTRDIHRQPPQPWQSTYPLFSATQCVARYCNGLRKLIQWSCSGAQN